MSLRKTVLRNIALLQTVLKQLPWMSLGLLFVSHIAFGWFLLEPGANVDPAFAKFAWAFILCFDIIVVGTLTASPNTLRAKFMRWTSSNEGRLFSVIILAFFAAMFLVFIRLFGYVLVLSLSLTLARLDMLAVGFNDLPVLILLLSIALLGFGIGWQANKNIQSPLDRRLHTPRHIPNHSPNHEPANSEQQIPSPESSPPKEPHSESPQSSPSRPEPSHKENQ